MCGVGERTFVRELSATWQVGTVGGFCSRAAMEGALQQGMDFVSVCSSICVDQLAVQKLLSRRHAREQIAPLSSAHTLWRPSQRAVHCRGVAYAGFRA